MASMRSTTAKIERHRQKCHCPDCADRLVLARIRSFLREELDPGRDRDLLEAHLVRPWFFLAMAAMVARRWDAHLRAHGLTGLGAPVLRWLEAQSLFDGSASRSARKHLATAILVGVSALHELGREVSRN